MKAHELAIGGDVVNARVPHDPIGLRHAVNQRRSDQPHTPTPWHVDPMRGRGDKYADYTADIWSTSADKCIGRLAQSSAKGEALAQADVDHIVRCVNAWDNAKALRERLAELDRA